jgi:DinB superfamily
VELAGHAEEEGAIAMAGDAFVREQLSKLLAWEDAHVGFDTVVADIPPELRGKRPAGTPHSPWELVEHLRITQRDILDFCRNPDYEEMSWPADYWPTSPAPPTADAWDESIDQFRRDRKALQDLAEDPAIDLAARIPHGSGQTYFRELVLVADHTSYHVGALVLVRRLLGSWKAD